MKQLALRLSLIVAALAPAALTAQAAAPVDSILTIYRESVKPGKSDAHNAHESAWARAIAATKSPAPFLAVTAVSGANENLYISAFTNWAALEKANKANADNSARVAIDKQYSAPESEYLSDGREIVLTRRADLSYGPPPDLAGSRYLVVTRVSIRPGHAAEYVENRRRVKAAYESINAPDSYSMWQVALGAPTDTYYILVPVKSLAEYYQATTTHGAAFMAALGDSVTQQKMVANQKAAIISWQTDVFAFAPQQSVPPAAWIAKDPGFWKHKSAPKKTP